MGGLKEFEKLGTIVTAISSVSSEFDVYSGAVRALTRILPDSHASVALRQAAGEILGGMVLQGQDDGCLSILPLDSVEEGVFCADVSGIWRGGEAGSCGGDTSLLAQQGMRSVVNAPIVVGNTAVGCINLASEQKKAYCASDHDLLVQIAAFIGICIDRLQLMDKLEAQAQTDVLTGLVNRQTFRQKLKESLSQKKKNIGLLLIDLDGFKFINDTNGQLAGDRLLKGVAGRLSLECERQHWTVGRLGGDEFALAVEDCDAGRALEIANTLQAEIAAPFRLDCGRSLQISASVGIAIAPVHGEKSETLLSHADMALYSAKASARKTAISIFTKKIASTMKERLHIECDLREALENSEGLFLFYQPIIDIQSRCVVAREGLVRWHHPKYGWIRPDKFIPVAEDVGLIDQLGIFVIDRACRDAATWNDDAAVAVNVSACQIGDGAFSSVLRAVLNKYDFPARRFEIEVTESVLFHSNRDCLTELHAIRDTGVNVALDDFGTGFSSLACLRAFPFDKIKIDGSFVRDALVRDDCAAIVRAVAGLGKSLGTVTVAEGVKTNAHLDYVTQQGCTQVQGYLLGRPMPAENDIALVEALS